MKKISSQEMEYIIWQNRAFSFYLAARRLYHDILFFAAAYCVNACLELILKATLVYWVKSYSPKIDGHDLAKLLRRMAQDVPNGERVVIPIYFFEGKRYQEATRYPMKDVGGTSIPHEWLEDLDEAFVSAIELVEFQWNSRLGSTLYKMPSHYASPELKILRRHNKQVRRLRQFIRPRCRKR